MNLESSSPLSNFVKFVLKIFGLVAVVCVVVGVGGGSVTGAGDGGVSLATERVKDAPLSMRSRSVLDPCNFPSSLGSYRQRSPGALVVIPAPDFLIRSLSKVARSCVDGRQEACTADDTGSTGENA